MHELNHVLYMHTFFKDFILLIAYNVKTYKTEIKTLKYHECDIHSSFQSSIIFEFLRLTKMP